MAVACVAFVSGSVSAQTPKYTWWGHDLSGGANSPIFINGKEANDDNTCYLFNVGASEDMSGNRHGLRTFLNVGGHWGVEAQTFEVGTPVYLYLVTQGSKPVIEILTSPNPDGNQPNRYGWVRGGTVTNDDKGIFYDRKSENVESPTLDVKTHWQCYSVGNYHRWNTNDKVYWIYPRNISGYHYLCHPGDDKESRHDICVARQGVENSSNSWWIVVTRKDLKEAFKKIPADYYHMADATFYIHDQNFARNNPHRNKWILEPNSEDNSSVTIGNGKDQTEADKYTSYTVGTDNIDTDYTTVNKGSKTAYNLLYGGFFNAQIKGGRGRIKQVTEKIERAGYYMVTCQGFYRPGDNSEAQNAYLYAKTSNPTAGNVLGSDAYSRNKLPLWSSIADGPTTMTKAGIKFYQNQENYSSKVIVWVNENETLELGVTVEGVTSNKAEDWTALDNMQIKFLGEEFPVWETFGEEANYTYYGNVNNQTMVLLRQFQLNKWNTFVLPTSLNKDQVVTAFGTDVKLAKLTGLDDSGANISFASVDLNKLSWTDEAIVANEPYLIMPQVDGRMFNISWGKLNGVLTAGPHYIIPVASIALDKINPNNKKSFQTTDGKTIELIPNYFWSVDENKAHGRIPASPDTYVYAMSEGMLKRYKKDFKMKGTRWYLRYSGAPSSAKMLSVDNIDFMDNTTTGIDEIQTNGKTSHKNVRSGIYNLKGQKVADGEKTDGLPVGLYIIDGKKVMVY